MNAIGTTVLQLPSRTVLRRFRLPVSDLVVLVVEGDLSVTDERGTVTRHGPGEVVVCPRGRARTLASRDGARLLVSAVPSGPEGALVMLLGPPDHSGDQLRRAADAGIEVLLHPSLPPVPAAGDGPSPAGE